MLARVIDVKGRVLGQLDIEGTSWIVDKDEWMNATTLFIPITTAGYALRVQLTTVDGIPLNSNTSLTVSGKPVSARGHRVEVGDFFALAAGLTRLDMYITSPEGIKLT